MKLQAGDRVRLKYLASDGVQERALLHVGRGPEHRPDVEEAVYYVPLPDKRLFTYHVDGKTIETDGWDLPTSVVFIERPAPLLDLTKPVQTRDGRAVRILSTNGPTGAPVVGVIVNDAPIGEVIYQWPTSGKGMAESGVADLMNVPPPPPAKVTTTVYLWRSKNSKEPRVFVTTKPDMRDHKKSGGGATLIGKQEVTVTEGDNL